MTSGGKTALAALLGVLVVLIVREVYLFRSQWLRRSFRKRSPLRRGGSIQAPVVESGLGADFGRHSCGSDTALSGLLRQSGSLVGRLRTLSSVEAAYKSGSYLGVARRADLARTHGHASGPERSGERDGLDLPQAIPGGGLDSRMETTTQFPLNRQAQWLKEYTDSRGARLVGNLPFFFSLDSSDLWVKPELFHLDERRRHALLQAFLRIT